MCTVKQTVVGLTTEMSDKTEEITKLNLSKLTKLVQKLEKDIHEELEQERIDKMPEANK